MRLIARLGILVQLAVAHGSYRYYAKRRHRLPKVSWVIGPGEVASMARQLQAVIPNSFTFFMVRNPYYEATSDYYPPETERLVAKAWRLWVKEPALFARLAATAKGFLYLNELGFLDIYRDEREFEFSFLAKRGVKIVCYFTGSDIRSARLMKEHELKTGLPNIDTYLGQTNPELNTPEFHDSRQRVAEVADRYATAMFNYPVDQMSYLQRETIPSLYIVPDDSLVSDLSKFDDVTHPVVLHAPTSPVIKGTQLVRAAVEQLKREGFEFEYVELQGVPNHQVVEHLSRAHIALNQFYAHVPGVFGVEAMAAGCVLLNSADESIETALPRGSNQAWVVTKHWQVADNLRSLLLHPENWRAQAEAGQQWLRQHAVASVSGAKIRQVLDSL